MSTSRTAPGTGHPSSPAMRARHGRFPEYHTSLDDLTLITPAGLSGSYEAIRKCIVLLEHNRTYSVTTPCEPQLGKRGLYPTLSTRGAGYSMRGSSTSIGPSKMRR